jgi:hypothetical protein
MSELNVGTLNVGTTQFTGDSSTQNTVPTIAGLIGGSPANGQVLKWNGSAWVAGSADAAGRLLAVNGYTNDPGSSGASIEQMRDGGTFTWTKPTGCNNVLVYVTGAGAGSSSNDSSYRGWTGGGGATAISWIDVSSTASVTVTTGSGSQGVRGMGRAGQGGTSSFGSFCSATGGRGGGEVPYGGGRGGIASGGNIANIPGGGGEGSHGDNVEMGGGCSFWHRTGGAHNNGNGQGDSDSDRRERLKGRFGSGGGTCYGSQTANESWRSGGAGFVMVFSYS